MTNIFVFPSLNQFEMGVAGPSYHHGDIDEVFEGAKISKVKSVVVTVLLVPEPANRFDKNAVKVAFENKHFGYLSRNDAVYFHRQLKRHHYPKDTCIQVECKIVARRIAKKDANDYNLWLDYDHNRQIPDFVKPSPPVLPSDPNSPTPKKPLSFIQFLLIIFALLFFLCILTVCLVSVAQQFGILPTPMPTP